MGEKETNFGDADLTVFENGLAPVGRPAVHRFTYLRSFSSNTAKRFRSHKYPAPICRAIEYLRQALEQQERAR